MKFFAAATLAAGLLVSTAASAAQVYTVQAWINTPASQGANTADLAHYNLLSGTEASATFIWSGPIDWSDTSGQNNSPAGGIASNFFSKNGALPTNFADHAVYDAGNSLLTQAQFLASSLTIAADSYSTFYRITTSYSSPNDVVESFSHDDGASVYLDGALSPLAGTTSGETSVVTENVTLTAGSHDLTLFYVSGNGTPSVLNFSSPGSVPEPASWALMIAGFGGLGAALRRKRALGALSAAA
jgi:hypothetical protein